MQPEPQSPRPHHDITFWYSSHSYRSATTGSTRIALRTGTMAAAKQTPARARIAEAIERGSVLLRPKSIASNTRVAATAAAIPIGPPMRSEERRVGKEGG